MESLNIKKLLNGFILMIYFQRKEINRVDYYQ